MDDFTHDSAYFLILRYPTIGDYIQRCYNQGDYATIIDFLFDLETDDRPSLYN